MPRHPPNAQKNKQQKTHEQNKKQVCRRNLTVRCSRPLYSSQPTHPHPPTTPNKSGAPDGSGNQGALPQNPDSMPPPHAPSTREGTHHQQTTTTTRPQQPTTAGVFPTPLTRQANPTREKQASRDTVSQPSARASTPGRPRPINDPDKQTARKPLPHKYLSLERR